MLFHAGVLDEGHSSRLARIKSQQWAKLPAELRLDLDVSLLTPGFSNAWWTRALHRSINHVTHWRRNIDPSLRSLAIDNWNSINRDDAVRLSRIEGHMPIPVLIQMRTDIKNGMTQVEAEHIYGCSRIVSERIMRQPYMSGHTMPDWFRSLIPAT